MADKTTPARAVVRPPSDDGVLPEGVDYPDEVRGDDGSMRGHVEDDISLAVGSFAFVARPGRSWVPWADGLRLPGTQGLVTFDRLYPAKRLLVDVFPSPGNLEPKARARMAEEKAYKTELCHAHGYGYIAHDGMTPLDARVFAEEARYAQLLKESPKGDAAPPPTPTLSERLASMPDTDALSNLVGSRVFMLRAGPPTLPWAWQNEGKPYAKPLVFTRWYYRAPLLVDILPRPELTPAKERAERDEEVAFKRRLCKKMKVPYLVMHGTVLPTQAEVDRLLGRRASDVRVPSGTA